MCKVQKKTIRHYSLGSLQLLLLLKLLVVHSSLALALPSEEDEVVTETITIGQEIYPVPFPWAGNKFAYPRLTPENFKQIPTEFTVNGTKLYILEEAQNALVAMLDAAQKDQVELLVESGYRSRGYQTRIFTRMLEQGRTYEDIIRYVAPPGYSQHGLGTAVDFYPSNWEFAAHPAYTWLRENGAKFGFVETYPQYNRLKYPWEAWHWNFQKTTP